MCGIAGFLTTRRQAEPGSAVGAMLDLIAHRGPDGRGVTECRGPGATAIVGAVRLSLLDLPHGHQPMVTADGSTVLVFNGEITNHEDLRRRYLRDHPFSSRCDTETLLALWERLGPDCVARLEGMFAFGVASGGELWLARDRAGIKPLFVHTGDPRKLSFASETKAFLALPRFHPMLDPRALVECSAVGHPLDGRTWWEDVVEVEPGTVLHVAGGPSGEPIGRSAGFVPRNLGAASIDDSPDALGTLLDGCVARHLASDHPTGVFLSGGLDSTVIAALAVQASGRSGSGERLHSFTFGDDPGLEDVEAARLVAQALGTEHHESVVSLPDVVRSLADCVWDGERPGTDVGASLVIASAREHVKSALVGEGSDELFAGYWVHREPLAYVRQQIARYVACYRWHGGAQDEALFEALRRTLVRLSVRSEDEQRRRVRQFFLGSPLRSIHLHRWDHSSMAASLEVRVPYLSKEVYEHGEALMEQRRPDHWGDKPHLREVARRVLPESVAGLVTRRPKRPEPANFNRLHRRLAAYAAQVVPEEHVATHPLRHCLGPASGGQALGVLLMDLFLMSFVVRRCRPVGEEDPAALYRRPAELALLGDALAQIELPVNERPLDGTPRDLARIALAPGSRAAATA